MNTAQQRKYRKRKKFLNQFLMKNPVLILGLDLPFVIVCGTTLKNAVAMSVELLIIHMVTMLAALITVRTLPLWSRVLVNMGVATIMMTLARAIITTMFPDISNYVGMYIYLMAVNGLTFYQSTYIKKAEHPVRVLRSAFLNVLAFSLTIFCVAFFRELIGNGTLWGTSMQLSFKFSGIAMPFAGFIIMGFLLAFVKQFNKLLSLFTISESIRSDQKYTEIVSGAEE